MSYLSALEAAGAEVVEFKVFGSYQGSWFAIVQYKGKTLIIQGEHGSCSGCDAFKAEFEDCYTLEVESDYQTRLKKFGEFYLNNASVTVEEALKSAKNWDLEADEMHSWLESLHKIYFSNRLEDIIND